MEKIPSKEATFEAMLEKLEAVVTQLEGGQLPLEQSLKLYEKGIGFVRGAQERLKQMETKIEELSKDGSKQPFTVPGGPSA